MTTRIIMDKEVRRGDKVYIAGKEYDSRIPADCPAAADGIQHSIPQHLLEFFLAQGWAHEESWDEWLNRHPLWRMPGEVA